MSTRLYFFGGPCKTIDPQMNETLTKALRSDVSAGTLRHRTRFIASYLVRPGTELFTGKPILKPERAYLRVPLVVPSGAIAMFWADATSDGTIDGAVSGWADQLLRDDLLRAGLRLLHGYYPTVGLLVDYLSGQSEYSVARESLETYLNRKEEARYHLFAIIDWAGGTAK